MFLCFWLALMLVAVIGAIGIIMQAVRLLPWKNDKKGVGILSLIMLVVVTIGLGGVAVLSGYEAYNRLTAIEEIVQVTVSDSATGTRALILGKGGIFITDYTTFRCKEFERSFEVGGRRNWRAGQQVKLRIYRREGDIVAYDFLGEVKD